jgi:hypothetical protein
MHCTKASRAPPIIQPMAGYSVLLLTVWLAIGMASEFSRIPVVADPTAETSAQFRERSFNHGHLSAECRLCHAMVATTDNAVPASTNRSAKCLTCHETGALTGQNTFHERTRRDCLDCHSFHRSDLLTAGGFEFTLDFQNGRRRSQCVACHNSREDLTNLSPGHQAAAALYHSNRDGLDRMSPSETCLMCHGQGRPPEGMAHLATATERVWVPRVEAHGSHPVGLTVPIGRGTPGNQIRDRLDDRIILPGGKLECSTCHSLSARPGHLAAGFTSENDLCRACHELDR